LKKHENLYLENKDIYGIKFEHWEIPAQYKGWSEQFYIGQANQSNIYNFQSLILICSCDSLMIIGLADAWSVPPPLQNVFIWCETLLAILIKITQYDA